MMKAHLFGTQSKCAIYMNSEYVSHCGSRYDLLEKALGRTDEDRFADLSW